MGKMKKIVFNKKQLRVFDYTPKPLINTNDTVQ